MRDDFGAIFVDGAEDEARDLGVWVGCCGIDCWVGTVWLVVRRDLREGWKETRYGILTCANRRNACLAQQMCCHVFVTVNLDY